MRFALSEDQRLLHDSVNRVLDQLSPLERVRRFADGTETSATDLWAGLTDLGVPGLLIDEADGGLGLGLLEAALVAEALGAHVTPAPFLGSAVLAPLALQHSASARLSRLAAGEATAGVAISEAVAGARDGAGVRAESGKLTGKALFVLDADADVLIVADRDGGVHLVESIAGTVMPTIDATRRLYEVAFDAAPAEPLDCSIDTLRDAAWIILAADTLGAAQAMLDKAVAYAKERQQFGRVIGSFQAVKHLCAEMAAELEPARALVWYAAYAFDHEPQNASLAAAHAKAHLSEIGRFVARTATEVHGGMGITDLLGLHYWFKRIGLNRQLYGGPERVRETAARLQGLIA